MKAVLPSQKGNLYKVAKMYWTRKVGNWLYLFVIASTVLSNLKAV